jgi:hypothetical protein
VQCDRYQRTPDLNAKSASSTPGNPRQDHQMQRLVRGHIDLLDPMEPCGKA